MDKEVRAASGHVGELIRHWRTVRAISQLALAMQAEISTRHLSYLEAGRAIPSREMILRLSEALQIPLRERNILLLAGGYAPLYRETDINTPEMAEARRALEFILAQQEPYPAIVLDRHWNLLMRNGATRRFFALFLESAPPVANGTRLMFHPQGLRPYVQNWEEVAARIILRLHREVAANPADAGTRALLEELLGYPDIPSRWRTPNFDASPAPAWSVCYRKGERIFRFFSVLATFGAPQDVTLQELRIESFFPADEPTRLALVQLAAGS